jgi:hypothetical protein
VTRQRPIPRKRRTREHIIADLSVNHVERHILLCGWTVQRAAHDYGIDLEMRTYDRQGEIENGQVYLQLKATDHLKVSADGQEIPWRLERADLCAWIEEPWPVIVVVYDAAADTAYWLYVQAYFAKQKGFNAKRGSRTVTVRIPRSRRLDGEAVQGFARFRDAVMAQTRGKVEHHE